MRSTSKAIAKVRGSGINGLNLHEIARMRLISQQIATTKFSTPGEIVQWMGAMQAQDFAMAKWAIGIRLPDSTESTVQESLNQGEIFRTHLLRPTWHFVSPQDIYWMLDLTAPRIRQSVKSRQRDLELTPALLKKSNDIIGKVLDRDKQLVREALVNELTKAKIPTDNNRTYHILLWAELEGIICSGAARGNKQTYSLLARFVPKKKGIPREEAIARLAARYFTSHSPATLPDFKWWSGLSVAEARSGIEMNRSFLNPEVIGPETYWLPDSFTIPSATGSSVFLIPAFDEFIISYANRNAVLDWDTLKKSISDNGIFRPVIVIDGQVTGLWKRTLKKDILLLETEFYRKHTKKELSLIQKESERLGRFLKMEVLLKTGLTF